MSSGHHLSKELYDLIKSIGETKSKQEEDKIIANEVNVLKAHLAAKGIPSKKMKEYLMRAVYIEMLGHDASFAHIHAVNLTQDKFLPIKRMGYLACTLFLNENSELLILLVANLQRDLQSSSPFEILVALNTLCKLICPTIAHGFVDPVVKHLNHGHELIRKKAVMVFQKLLKLCPQNITDPYQKLRKALCDKDPSVMGASLNVYYERVKENTAKYKEMTSDFVVILKQVIEHKLTREFDYHRMPAPWIQIKLLQILSILGANDKKTSEQIYEVLGLTMKRADDTGINIGYAITYQCIKTIATIYPNQALLETAATTIARFISNENNNLRYLGINALISLVQVNPKAAAEHQITVVECLESRDETLQFETLELVYRMANPQNIEIIVEKLILQLKMSTDNHFKKDIVNKIYSVCEKYAPDPKWFVLKVIDLIEDGAEFITKDIINNIIKLIEENFEINGNDFGSFVITTFLEIFKKDTVQEPLIKIISWSVGEIGSTMYSDDENSLEQLAYALTTSLQFANDDPSTITYIITALGKIYAASGFKAFHVIDPIFEKYSKSKVLEVQQRSFESRIAKNHLNLLKGASKIVLDPDLSFLDGYVAAAVQKGSKPYDQTKARKILFGIATQAPTTTTLNFTPYTPAQPQFQTMSNHGTLKKPDDPTFKPKPTNEPKPIQPIATQQFKPKLEIKQEDPKLKEKKELAAGLFGAVDLTFKNLGQNKTTFTNNPVKPITTTQNQSVDILGLSGTGVSNSLAKQPINPIKNVSPVHNTPNLVDDLLDFVSNVPPVSTANTQQKTQSGPVIPQQAKKNVVDIDLLDMDFSSIATQPTQPNNAKPIQNNPVSQPQATITMNPTQNYPPKSTPTSNPLVTGTNISNLTGVKLPSTYMAGPQMGMNPVGQGNFQKPPLLQPFQMTVQDYENNWKILAQEKNETFKFTNLRTDADFKTLCSKIGFYVISIVSNEGICSGRINGQTYLLYGTFEANGTLNGMFKGPDVNILNQIIQNLKLLNF